MRKSLLLAGLVMAAPAWSCNQGDLAGRWNLFVEDFSCLMTVQPDGRVTAGQCQQMGEDPDDRATRDPVRGRLKMQADCRVTGRLNTARGDGRDVRLVFGQTRLATDLRTWHGLTYVGVGSSPAFDLGNDDSVSGEYRRFSAVYID